MLGMSVRKSLGWVGLMESVLDDGCPLSLYFCTVGWGLS
jgi:hypothetical protein